MHFSKIDERGIGHYLVIGGVVGVLAIGSVGTAVYKAGHNQNKSLQGKSSSSSAKKSTLTADAKTQTDLKTEQTTQGSAQPGTSTTTPAASKTQTKTPASTTPVSTDQKAPAQSPAPAPTQSTATTLSILTEVISNFETNGGPLNVTRDTVTVAGPIRNATAKPIVFGFQDKLYFAYTQTNKPNFGTSAAATAGSMAIIPANVASIAQVAAHLDKANNLVDSNFALVGFSTGGN